MRIEIFTPRGAHSGEGMPVNPALARLKRYIPQLSAAGIEVEIYELDADPVAFAAPTGMAELLQSKGNGVLPVSFIDGKPVVEGRYLQVEEIEREAALWGIRIAFNE